MYLWVLSTDPENNTVFFIEDSRFRKSHLIWYISVPIAFYCAGVAELQWTYTHINTELQREKQGRITWRCSQSMCPPLWRTGSPCSSHSKGRQGSGAPCCTSTRTTGYTWRSAGLVGLQWSAPFPWAPRHSISAPQRPGSGLRKSAVVPGEPLVSVSYARCPCSYLHKSAVVHGDPPLADSDAQCPGYMDMAAAAAAEAAWSGCPWSPCLPCIWSWRIAEAGRKVRRWRSSGPCRRRRWSWFAHDRR